MLVEESMPTFLSCVIIVWYGVEVAAEATGAVGMALAELQGDVGCVIDGDREAKLLTPELVRAELRSHKHRVRCKGQRKS